MDEVLLLDENKDLGNSSFRVISLCNSQKVFLFLHLIILILLNNFRNLFIFCIYIDIEEVLLLDKNNCVVVNSFIVVYLFVILEKQFRFLLLILLI